MVVVQIVASSRINWFNLPRHQEALRHEPDLSQASSRSPANRNHLHIPSTCTHHPLHSHLALTTNSEMPSTDTRGNIPIHPTSRPNIHRIPGCYECTKRRIICDATEPSCKKCQKKGIECSGLSRFRFAAGIAKRGRWKGCPIPVADVSPESALERQRQAERSVPRRIRWRAPDCREDRAVKAASVAADTTEASSSPSDEADEQDQNLDEVVGHDRELVVLVPSVSSWIAPLCARTRMLFSHCKCPVCPGEVVIGLPFACSFLRSCPRHGRSG